MHRNINSRKSYLHKKDINKLITTIVTLFLILTLFIGMINVATISSSDNSIKTNNSEMLDSKNPNIVDNRDSLKNLKLSDLGVSTDENQLTIENINNPDTIIAAAGDFVSRWNSSITNVGSTPSNQIQLPLVASGSYNFVVDWGDQTSDTITSWDQTEVTHTYSTDGVYDITISGTIEGWSFDNDNDKEKLIEILQWGDLQLGNSGGYFAGAENLVITASDSPDLTSTTSLYEAFYDCSSLGSSGNFNSWDVSSITNMSRMFAIATSFNQPLNNWDVSNVKDMSYMFSNTAFNQSIGNWDVSKVSNMDNMFVETNEFNQPLNSWDVSNVNSMSLMFKGTSFNQNIETWDVSNVTDMSLMFGGTPFNQPLNNWDVSNVTNMQYMFNGAPFNQPLNNWDTSNVLKMNSIFRDSSFNQPIDNWDVSNVIDMSYMFHRNYEFDQPINSWDVGNVTNMRSMFDTASSFNQPLDSWNVSSVTNMALMFENAISFNQPIEMWDVSKVTTLAAMFNNASSFNQPLNNWNVSSVTSMHSMFSLSPFDQDISNWNVSQVSLMVDMFDQVTLSTSNYDKLLNGWSEHNLQTGISFNAGNSQYSHRSYAAKQYIINEYGWSIADGGILVDNTIPQIISPIDISYEKGTTGNTLSWILEDDNPDIFNVYRNDTVFIGDTSWSNGSVGISIDGLPVGIHVFTIYAYDIKDNVNYDSVTVEVLSITDADYLSPSIHGPSDLTLEMGAVDDTITWNVEDENPNTFIVYRNGAIHTAETRWTNGTISIELDKFLDQGTYNYTIVVYDTNENFSSDSVIVTVNPPDTEGLTDTDAIDDPDADESFVSILPNFIAFLNLVILSILFRRRNRS